MNFKKYYKSLETMPKPLLVSQLPKAKIDINGIIRFARSKEKKVSELTKEEQDKFIVRY